MQHLPDLPSIDAPGHVDVLSLGVVPWARLVQDSFRLGIVVVAELDLVNHLNLLVLIAICVFFAASLSCLYLSVGV